jgi:glycosyltransferase involved in cell wall biosynthesis
MSSGSPTTWLLERINRFCIRRADRAVVLGRCMRARVAAKGIPSQRLAMINVWADPDEIRPVDRASNPFRREWGIGERLLVMYSGNFGIGHDVATIARGVEELRDDPNVVFAFVGGGKRKDELIGLLRSRGLTNFIEAPYQPREKINDLLGAADIHLASLLEGTTGIMVPSKFYGVLAAARPILFIGERTGEVARTIEEERCGFIVAPGDVDGFARALRRLATDRELAAEMGGRARRYITERAGAPHAMRRWNELLIEVAGDRARVRAAGA